MKNLHKGQKRGQVDLCLQQMTQETGAKQQDRSITYADKPINSVRLSSSESISYIVDHKSAISRLRNEFGGLGII